MTAVYRGAGVLDRLAGARQAARQLLLLFDEPAPILDAMGLLLDCLAGEEGGDDAWFAYRRLFRLLANEAEFHEGELIGGPWRHHLLNRLLSDDNAFSRKAARLPEGTVSPALRAAASHDLRCLQVLFNLDSGVIRQALHCCGAEHVFVPWEDLRPLSPANTANEGEALALMRAFAAAPDWAELVDVLARYYSQAGNGLFARYRAFRWAADEEGGHLEGVAHPDPITFEELIGYDLERGLLLRNTEHFLAGLPANNVLLYGDRGTGKSSSIKALLSAFAGRGLRLVEVQKQDLSAFPRILEVLRGRRERFILFIDDLSFEENETFYKQLKAVLEGGLEARPENVLLYATSNRRHLITERWSDREGDSEIHTRDASQEKLSLSDRFGITITFLSPSQEQYLAIVEGLARRRGLDLPSAEVQRQALQWAARHNGWSGRSARQFLDFALGEQARTGTGN